ncbi:S26 family signal peptidase [Actinokineospora iranica]|uniref:Peptidase S24-like n=1 Tax=Actinokineospora iranica TaxID=1271860 RepID=A0A1G6SZU2_9PSEU|nr:S26 family signal peptidase [Actinokineospora iranica]SDD22283.1 Peptidase S24-like [Actinokineospora iranica]
MTAANPLGRAPARRVRVRGASMRPALSDGDTVVATRRQVAAGAIVLVTWDARPGQLSVKRAVHRDGEGWHVEGDNAGESTDSRTLGPARVHAVIRWRLWPRPRRL